MFCFFSLTLHCWDNYLHLPLFFSKSPMLISQVKLRIIKHVLLDELIHDGVSIFNLWKINNSWHSFIYRALIESSLLFLVLILSAGYKNRNQVYNCSPSFYCGNVRPFRYPFTETDTRDILPFVSAEMVLEVVLSNDCYECYNFRGGQCLLVNHKTFNCSEGTLGINFS